MNTPQRDERPDPVPFGSDAMKQRLHAQHQLQLVVLSKIDALHGSGHAAVDGTAMFGAVLDEKDDEHTLEPAVRDRGLRRYLVLHAFGSLLDHYVCEQARFIDPTPMTHARACGVKMRHGLMHDGATIRWMQNVASAYRTDERDADGNLSELREVLANADRSQLVALVALVNSTLTLCCCGLRMLNVELPLDPSQIQELLNEHDDDDDDGDDE